MPFLHFNLNNLLLLYLCVDRGLALGLTLINLRLIMGLGTALRQLRKSKGITLAELAERAGSHVGNLSRIERRTAKPSLDLLYRLSEALDFSLAEIFSAADNRNHDDKQVALNSVFIALLDQDRELLLDFAQLLQERAARDPTSIKVDDRMMPGQPEEDEEDEEERRKSGRDRKQRKQR
ncbi:MAG: helix-turn-helix transcriptional regulator [Marinobacter sp.]|uniref:helix-turn-helix domain-containing protein n=1 Tax=Marinobacter sp. TaxID=50741 RepID=UPI00299D04E8|nr:helix-turn-helix transcriptional regulator [Marinobacter sp.]MDX1634861.1 helix-turn-helix transcriptional regulator [Marinobacter sp.]